MGVLTSAAALMALVCSGKPLGVSAAVQWMHGGGICGGADDTTATVYIGVKGSATCADNSNRPAEYITMDVEGLAALRQSVSAYLTNSSQLYIIEATSFLAPQVEQFTEGSITYGRVVAGAQMGNPDTATAWGFVGTASYLVGSGTFGYNTNEFVLPGDTAGSTTTVSGICVVPIDANGNCGANRTAGPGTFKFSLYGYTGGSHFATWAADYTHVGARQTVNFANMGAGASVSFNSGATLANIGSTSVTSLTISGSNTTLAYAFPTTYNVGSVASGMAVPAASPSVIIHAVPHATDTTKFHLDYLFALANGLQGADGYFVYDPDVTSGTTGTGGTSSSTGTSSTSTSTTGTSSSGTGGGVTASTAPKTRATCMSLVVGLSAIALFVH